MTGKAPTLIAKLGFRDDDLTTPEHDAIMLALDAWLRREGLDTQWEAPLYKPLTIHQRGQIQTPVGYADLVAWSDDKILMFEVKTNIPSLGALIRELRFYEHLVVRINGGVYPAHMTVVCPDDRWAEQLRQQGYLLIQPPGGEP